MIDQLFNDLTLADYHGDLHRNIVSIRESQDLFDDLSPNPIAWKAAVDLEISAKPHTYISQQTIIDRPFEEATYNEAIQYPFNHWSCSRYSDGSFGVWYGSDTLETSIYETVYHWHKRFLEDAGWQARSGIIGERKVYLVRCDAALLDFIPKLEAFPALSDASSAYHFTHQVGARISHDGHPGLVSRSARCEGDIYAIFNAKVLSNPRHICYLSYHLREGGRITVERQPGEVLLTI